MLAVSNTKLTVPGRLWVRMAAMRECSGIIASNIHKKNKIYIYIYNIIKLH